MCTIIEDLVPPSYYSSTLIGVQVTVQISRFVLNVNDDYVMLRSLVLKFPAGYIVDRNLVQEPGEKD